MTASRSDYMRGADAHARGVGRAGDAEALRRHRALRGDVTAAPHEPPRLRTLDRGEVVPVLAARLEALDDKRVELERPLDDRTPPREDD